MSDEVYYCLTAFTVVIDGNGKAMALPLILPEGIQTVYPADKRAIKAACIEIADDIQAENSARYVNNLLEQLSEQIIPLVESFAPKPTPFQQVQEALKERGRE